MKKIGLFGGTFDPPHKGHLMIAKTVLKKLDLDAVWYIPTYHPPHKESATASAHDRLQMLNKMIEGEKGLSILEIEYERKGPSYTIDTVHLLNERYPDAEFFFIIGGDMIAYLPKWDRIDELEKLITFVGVERKGYQTGEDEDIKMVEIPDLPYSSTEIREKLKENQSVNGLTDKVYAYIKENGLYED